MITQSKIKNRKRLSAGVIAEIERVVEQIAIRYNCSKSFVISVALADQFQIRKQERYDNSKIRKVS